MTDGHPALVAWLHDAIRSRGPIPFVDFMEAALYHPEHGYYVRPGATTGPEGDFYTSPDVHPAFGRLLARQIAEIADRTSGREAPFSVVEAGAGTGRLAAHIIEGLAAERPDLASRTRYTLVEVSDSMRRAQRERLGGLEAAERLGGIEWKIWDEALAGRADLPPATCLVANEFLDAMPVHLVERSGSLLREVHVAASGDGFTEVLLEPGTERLSKHLLDLGIDLEEGQRAEIGLPALDWVTSLGSLFGEGGRGGAILIDYGHPARELYDPSRHDGTLLCYHRHRASEDPYERVGWQDMTAHVDFTSVELRARAAGFDVAPPTSQMHFLVSLGLAELFARAARANDAASIRERLALHSLMTPGGMGDIFKVLLLAKGIPAADLTGARDPFRFETGALQMTGEV